MNCAKKKSTRRYGALLQGSVFGGGWGYTGIALINRTYSHIIRNQGRLTRSYPELFEPIRAYTGRVASLFPDVSTPKLEGGGGSDGSLVGVAIGDGGGGRYSDVREGRNPQENGWSV